MARMKGNRKTENRDRKKDIEERKRSRQGNLRKMNRNRKSETNVGQKKIEPTTIIYIYICTHTHTHKDSRVAFKILITFTKTVYIKVPLQHCLPFFKRQSCSSHVGSLS
jgi:hypothetical protein